MINHQSNQLKEDFRLLGLFMHTYWPQGLGMVWFYYIFTNLHWIRTETPSAERQERHHHFSSFQNKTDQKMERHGINHIISHHITSSSSDLFSHPTGTVLCAFGVRFTGYLHTFMRDIESGNNKWAMGRRF